METDTVQIPRKMLEEIYIAHEKIDRILETLEVLMDTETLKRLKKGEEELKKGDYVDAMPEEIEAVFMGVRLRYWLIAYVFGQKWFSTHS